MMRVMAYARLCGPMCLSAIVVSIVMGTARGQSTPRVQTTPSQAPLPFNPEQQMEQVNKWLNENRNNPARYLGDAPFAPHVQKTGRAINDAADGMAVAVALGGGLIVLLVGIYILKRVRTPIYARNQALDDPRLRLLMADMAAQAQKARAALDRESQGCPCPPGAQES
jgi:hypothetical protein